jgi:hypothetical protein
MPSADVPNDNTAVDRARYNNPVKAADADARDHTNVPKHPLLESQRACAVCTLDVLPYGYTTIDSSRYYVSSVVGNGACSDWAGVHVFEQM